MVVCWRSEKLDRANEEEDPNIRMAWVAAFCLGPFGANERTWKPFNPILGETFEVDLENGARFLAEQAWPLLFHVGLPDMG